VSAELNPALLPPGNAGPGPARAGGAGGLKTGGPRSIDRAGTVRNPASTGGPSRASDPAAPSFAEVLRGATDSTGALGRAVGSEPLRFSKHALARAQRRGISLDPATLGRLSEGVGRAAGKGSRDSVVLVDGTAFVVSVNSRTVVTAVGSQHMREHVFTNVDSAVIA
jgi:flagellar operon protein